MVGLAVGICLCAAGCVDTRAPVISPGVRWGNGDCSFHMVPDAGGCELWFSTEFSGRDKGGSSYGGIAHGHQLVGCGQRFGVCGGVLACDCPPDAG